MLYYPLDWFLVLGHGLIVHIVQKTLFLKKSSSLFLGIDKTNIASIQLMKSKEGATKIVNLRTLGQGFMC